jgi:hypothetical protein
MGRGVYAALLIQGDVLGAVVTSDREHLEAFQALILCKRTRIARVGRGFPGNRIYRYGPSHEI